MQVSHLKVRRVYTMKTSQHARREMESEVCGGKKLVKTQITTRKRVGCYSDDEEFDDMDVDDIE